MNEGEAKYPTREECILALLTTGDKSLLGKDMQRFYHKWVGYGYVNQQKLRAHMHAHLPGEKRLLYDAIMASFKFWDATQSKFGAPGWNVDQNSINIITSELETESRQLMSLSEALYKSCLQRAGSFENCTCCLAQSSSKHHSESPRVEEVYESSDEANSSRAKTRAMKEMDKTKRDKLSLSAKAMGPLPESEDEKNDDAVEATVVTEVLEEDGHLVHDEIAVDSENSESTSVCGIDLKRSEFKMKFEEYDTNMNDEGNASFHEKLSLSSAKKAYSTSDLNGRASRHGRIDRETSSKHEDWETFSDEVIEPEDLRIRSFDDILNKSLNTIDIVWEKPRPHQ